MTMYSANQNDNIFGTNRTAPIQRSSTPNYVQNLSPLYNAYKFIKSGSAENLADYITSGGSSPLTAKTSTQLGSLAGGFTGIPFGSTFGGALGSFLNTGSSQAAQDVLTGGLASAGLSMLLKSLGLDRKSTRLNSSH